MPGRITVVGSANVDFFMRVPHLPQKGESVNGGPFFQSFGGKGSNQAIAARRSGAEVAGVFNLGGDSFARELLALYGEEGIESTHILINDDMTCGAGMILVDANGDNAIATAWGANGELTPERVDAAEPLIASSDMVLLQMEVPDAAIERSIDLAKRHGVVVMLNYAPARPSEIVLDGRIDILVVNESEATALTGVHVVCAKSASEAARLLAEGGHGVIVVTLGAEGCFVRECGGGSASHPAFPVDAVDATAAGDTFCGALACVLSERKPLPEALRYATAAGALCVGIPGALPSIPTRAHIEHFLRETSSVL